jgi:uncharacterized Fe-S cluster-containing radical SAM superfamily protein
MCFFFLELGGVGWRKSEDYKLPQTVQETLSEIVKNQTWDISRVEK